MRDIQISRPVLIALVGAILVGGFLLFQASGSEDEVPPPVNAAATSATGATATGATKATGATGATGSAERKISTAEERRKKLIAKAEAAGMPLTIYEPLSEGKIVVIFFWEKQGKDDERTNDSVNKVKSEYGKRMVVVREDISNKSKYDGIAQAADVTQTPGLVMLYKKKADSWQGYIDATALYSHIKRLAGSS
ncbi:MAG: hypothetical protein ACSLFF_11300 [Solirubrobacterales bacterium]